MKTGRSSRSKQTSGNNSKPENVKRHAWNGNENPEKDTDNLRIPKTEYSEEMSNDHDASTRRQVLRYKSVALKYVGYENAGYIKFSGKHNIISDFYETSHTLNRNILFIRDKPIRVRNDSL